MFQRWRAGAASGWTPARRESGRWHLWSVPSDEKDWLITISDNSANSPIVLNSHGGNGELIAPSSSATSFARAPAAAACRGRCTVDAAPGASPTSTRRRCSRRRRSVHRVRLQTSAMLVPFRSDHGVSVTGRRYSSPTAGRRGGGTADASLPDVARAACGAAETGGLMREHRWSRWVVSLAVLAAGCVAARSPVATEAEFRRWSSEASGRAEAFARFEAMLSAAGVGGVVPAYDLWIADRLKPKCLVEPFVAPPDKDWPNIVPVLRFIRDHVEPAIGDVRVVSAYRDPAFNACVGGAPASTHKEFYAIDLLPVDRTVTRDRLISTLCAIHQREGARAGIGLGIYGGRRFHIDARSYRGWGADYRAASFPCRDKGAQAPSRDP
jgi:hypothetical protein